MRAASDPTGPATGYAARFPRFNVQIVDDATTYTARLSAELMDFGCILAENAVFGNCLWLKETLARMINR